MFGPESISRLAQEIDGLKKSRLGTLAMLHEKPDVIGRWVFVPIKVLLNAPQPRLIVFVHTDLFVDAGAEASERSRPWQLRPLESRSGDRNHVGVDHLAVGHPGINVLKSAIYL